jgi:starch phosphorylase
VESLYALLEQQVVPEFYDRDAQGLPSRWLGRVRESMAMLTPEFSASRAIREYTNDHYLPAAAGHNARAANDGKLGVDLLQWQRSIADQWSTVSFGKVTVETKDGQHRFEVPVVLGELHPDQFRVELYAVPTGENGSGAEIVATCKASTESSG